jgi:quercetin dioxygenase-like cupin family protein
MTRSVGHRNVEYLEAQNMAIHHASSGELIDIRPLNNALKSTPTTALFKSSHLEVSRTVLRAGKECLRMRWGEMTVQCLEGRVELSAAGTTQSMRAGDLSLPAGGETHSLKAIEDSSV